MKKGKSIWKWAPATLAAAFALAGVAISSAPVASARGGGGGVPSPFVAATNHRVELADGELYTLEGRVLEDPAGNLYFNVNLRRHPWLANARRVQNPYYQLVGASPEWRRYEGRTILLVATAHVVVSGGSYAIVLQPVNQNPLRSIVRFR